MKAFEGELLSRTQRQENLAAINAFCRCLQTWRAWNCYISLHRLMGTEKESHI